MKRKIALKRLSSSDLTFFERHFRHTSGTKQKAFNLDRSVLVDRLFPVLPAAASVRQGRVGLDLTIYGPGMAGPHNLQRKILKQQKNWRLDGELIYGPEDDTERYASLSRNDYAILDFSGEAEPSALKMYLISKADKIDHGLHQGLDARYSPTLSTRTSMVELDPDELSEIIGSVALPAGHPIADLLDADDLEDAAQGGTTGVRKLRLRRRARGVSQDEFSRSKRNAEWTGRLGEEILNSYFETLREKGEVTDFRWESDANAIAAFDFVILDEEHPKRILDAKSTAGKFSNPLHASMAEIDEMAQSEIPYDLYRLYDVKEGFARLRIAEDMQPFAIKLRESLMALPDGVSVDGVSIIPDILPFGAETIIDLGIEEEG